VAEGEEGPFLGGAERIVVHAGSPDMSAGFAGQGIIDGADQNLRTKRQQQLEHAAAQVIEVPAGLAEEAMERAIVFEPSQLRGLNDAGQRAAAGTEDPGARQGPEGMEAGLSEAGLKGEQQGSKGTD